MARYNSSSSASLRTRLSSLAEYLEAVSELRTLLLHSSPSVLISNPDELISLVEVAKTTLQDNGISLHTFSSCPDYLSAYKAAYFGLLLQLQAHSQNARLESRDLQARLNRLLFPLSTQLRVCTKADKQDVCGGYASQTRDTEQSGTEYKGGSTETSSAPLHSAASSVSLYLAKHPSSSPPNLPPNIMLPPPAPLRRNRWPMRIGERASKLPSDANSNRSCRSIALSLNKPRPTISRRWGTSNDTVHFKRRQGEVVTIHSSKSHGSLDLAGNDYVGEQYDTTESPESSSDDDDDPEPSHILVPSHSPLRRTFGIFCTGKGRGAFGGSMFSGQRQTRPLRDRASAIIRRNSHEDSMDSGS